MSDIILHVKTGGILKTPTESCALPPRGGAAVVRKLNLLDILSSDFTENDIGQAYSLDLNLQLQNREQSEVHLCAAPLIL
jgi:hypothetical protein